VYTLHIEAKDKIEMIVDTIGKADGSNSHKLECKAAAAKLKLESNYSLIDSTKTTSECNDFTENLSKVIILSKLIGEPLIFVTECGSSVIDNRRFTLIAKGFGCFSFEYVSGQSQLKSVRREGCEEAACGYFGAG
jgi:hypothetical protein